MGREKMVKELEKKFKLSKKNILNETVCMPEWPSQPEKKVEKKSK